MSTFSIFGIITSPTFQKCSEAAEYLNTAYSDDYHILVNNEVPRDYQERVMQLAVQAPSLKGADGFVDCFVIHAAAGSGNEVIMSGDAFLEEMQKTTTFKVLPIAADHPDSYVNRAQLSWLSYLNGTGNQYCWLDVSIDGAAPTRVTLELYAKLVPRTCNNFWQLCRGKLGSVQVEATPTAAAATATAPETIDLTYKNTTFFRILKEAWVMGGDVSSGHTGNGGYSCYGRYFPDESFAVKHDAAGILGMCNDGEHTNASSFYITMKRMSWMNGKYVAFGRVIDGFDTVRAIHEVEVKHNQTPRVPVTIVDCGVIDVTM